MEYKTSSFVRPSFYLKEHGGRLRLASNGFDDLILA